MREPSIKKNVFLSTCYQILNIILPLITAPYISRVIGSEGIGKYSFASSIQAYFSLFAALGTGIYGTREIAIHRNDIQERSRLFWEIELLSVITSSVMLCGWMILVITQKQYIYLLLTINLINTMADISWFYNGLEEFKITVIRNACVRIVGAILVFMFVKKTEDLYLYVGITATTSLLGTFSLWIALPKYVVRAKLELNRIPRHFKQTMVYFIPSVATSVYTVLDKTLIGVVTQNAYENGYYEQATKIISMIKAVTFASINNVLRSRISFLFSEKRYDEIKERILKSIDYILTIGFGSVFGLIGISKRFVPWFFGDGYDQVIDLLIMMSPLVLIIGISNCLGSHYYTPAGLKKVSAKFIVAGAIVNLVFNIMLIPRFQARGAVVSSVIAETLITILYVRNCNGYVTWKKLLLLGWKKAAAGAIMAIAVYYVGTIMKMDSLAVILQVIVGIIVYGVVCLLLKDCFVCKMRGFYDRS